MKKPLLLASLVLVFVIVLCACNGSSGFDATKNISVIAREDSSGTKSAFMEIIGLKETPDPANVIIQTGTAGVLA